MAGQQGSLREYVSLVFSTLVMTPSSSAVTRVRVGIDVAKVLVPKILKLAIPMGLAALAYVYIHRQQPVA